MPMAGRSEAAPCELSQRSKGDKAKAIAEHSSAAACEPGLCSQVDKAKAIAGHSSAAVPCEPSLCNGCGAAV